MCFRNTIYIDFDTCILGRSEKNYSFINCKVHVVLGPFIITLVASPLLIARYLQHVLTKCPVVLNSLKVVGCNYSV